MLRRRVQPVRTWRAALVAVLLALGGCAAPGIRPGVDNAERWQLSGRLGVRMTHLAESASLNWRQCGDRFDVRLSGPLGQAVARISGSGDDLTVWLDGHDPVQTADPEGLMRRQLGWSVPIRALRYWVRGEAAPGGAVRRSGPAAQPSGLNQFGWQVSYPAWYQRDSVALPARVVVSDPQLQATVLIHDWLLGDKVDCSS